MAGYSAKGRRFPFIIIRLWPQHHRNAAELRDLLGALKRNRRACDEVWFCTEIAFPPLAEHARSAELLASAADKVRALGIAPGLQIANTLGHGLSLLSDNSGAIWPFMMDENGNRVPPAPCPRSAGALEYIDRMTRLYAACKPSSIWIDDDLRMNAHGALKYGCFCPVCLRAFSEEQKRKYSRKSLLAALHNPAGGSVRLAWTKFNGESLAGIAGTIAKAAHAVAPDCRLGFQQLGHEQFMYSGPDWSPVLKTLAEESHQSAGVRAGHGYYTDHAPRQMIGKAFLISRQISRLPRCVDQVCPEVEGYNHNAFGKSAHGVAVESSLDLAMGCNSLSYAILCSGHEPMSWYETLLARLGQYRPFWEEYVRFNEGAAPGGLEVRLGLEHVARPLRSGEKPFVWSTGGLDGIYNLACLGLPLCTSPEAASAVILHADAVSGLADAELKQILSGGVMMDGLAALRIQDRGFGRMLGIRVEHIAEPVSVQERISGDRLNGVYAGRIWNALDMSSGVFMLRPLSGRVRALGVYEDRLSVQRGLATVLAENGSGGRVGVFGYKGWQSAPSGGIRNQYLEAADWISRGKLPVVCRSTAQVMVVPRVKAGGRLVSVFVLNTSIDATAPFDLCLRGAGAGAAWWMTADGRRSRLSLTGRGKERVCTVPSLPAWSAGFVAVDP